MQVSTCWDRTSSYDESIAMLSGLALRHALRGGEEGQKIAQLIASKDLRALAEYDLDFHRNWAPVDLIECRQALGFFQKLEDLDIGIDREAVSYRKFIESEEECKLTNDLFRALIRGSAYLRARDARVLYSARRKISRVLGPCPAISELKLRFGPGATTSLRKRDANPCRKMAQGFVCSDNLLHSGYLPSLLREVPHWADAHDAPYTLSDDGEFWCQNVTVALQPGRLEFVPKNAKTHRTIVVEPVLNSVLQLGIGDYIARRLKRHGLDITDQSRNGSLAKEGSVSGDLATLDLSSASDTISRELVRFLVPDDWFSLLNAARSSDVTYRGNAIHLHKFSSMGNGFTFPLETLVFWAVTQSSCEAGARIGIYGDDIICPTRDVFSVMRSLRLCGFTISEHKSFWSGPFRESCGKDYYLGIAVRPYYQKHLVSAESLFVLHNFYVRHHQYDDAREVVKLIPRPLRLYGPDGYGDGHLLSEVYPKLRPKRIVDKGYGGHLFETFSAKPRRETTRFPGDWVSPLYSVYTSGDEPLGRLADGRSLAISGSTPADTTKSGLPIWQLPGRDGYRRIAIYSLAP